MPRRRNTGSGSVYRPTYKAKDGTIKRMRVWWISWNEDGVRRYEATGCTLKDEAGAILHAKLAARALGKRTAKGVPLTVQELVNLVTSDYVANERRSTARAKLSAKHLVRVLGASTGAASVDEIVVTAYVATRQKEEAAAASINRELAHLRRAFRLAVKSRRLERRPDFSTLAENNARQGFWEEEQLRSVLRHLDEDLRPVIQVAFITGWRVHSEILTRQRRHLDLKAGWLRLEPGEAKNKRGRAFPLTAELRRVLEAQVKRTEALERKDGRVIPWLFHRNGEPIVVFRKPWVEALKKAGLPGKLLHDFRRTAVRNMERKGIARSAGKALVGHLTDSIYLRYAIVDSAMLKDAAKLLDAPEEKAQNAKE